MDTGNRKEENVSVPKFKIIKNGLDPKEVLAFIDTVMAKNRELAGQLRYIESLKKLAEKTVVEAHEQAENIKIEMLNEANDKANAIIEEAERKGKSEADRITAEAELKSEQSALQKINSARQESQAIIRAAEENAETIKRIAEQEAEKTIDKAKEKGEHLLSQRRELAEREAQVIAHEIIKEAQERAEQEALAIKKRAEQQIERSKKKAEGELKEKFKEVYREWLMSLEDVSETAIMTFMKEDTSDVFSGPDTGASRDVESIFKESRWQPLLTEEEEGSREGVGLYDGSIELLFPSLSGIDQMLQLIRRLRGIPRMKVLNLSIAPDKSILVNVFLETPISLLRVLESIPEVEKASGTLDEPEAAFTLRNVGEKSSVKRIVVTTKV
jgi:vacuolar-type H+-ATPase subunit H